MGQRERDRLKVLHEAEKQLITQRQAAEQLGITERQVRRLIARLRTVGDRAVVHGLRGRTSNRRIDEKLQKRAIAELRNAECRDFGPTYAAEHLSKRLGIQAGKDTVRQWMIGAGLWRRRKRECVELHPWRRRRACFGELVQWDTSVHDWLEGRGERIYLVAMIDDATSHLFARFVRHDSTEENLRVLWQYLESYGRPLEFYTDKAGLFEVTPKLQDKWEGQQLPLTQVTRALVELGIGRISAHSPQAKGRVERCFATAQDRLVKGLRWRRAHTLAQANQYLESEFLPEWNQRFTVTADNPTNAHRPLGAGQQLAAILSRVEQRTIANDYTLQFRGQRYQILKASMQVGMRGEKIRVEARLDGSLAFRYQGQYVTAVLCTEPPPEPEKAFKPIRKDHNRGGRSRWMREFHLQDSPAVWQNLRAANPSN
ncbi:MAG: ISNCY family transposase [Acidobacteriaceae bacterium]|nr:ISNCY family transposase [Acidobacteriaceae bacterium]